MSGSEYRLQAFIRSADRRSLIVDTSAGLSLGALPGLEHYVQSVSPMLSMVDGVVCSPGQIGKFGVLKKEAAGLLVRMDWSNTWRGADFVIPPHKAQRIPLLTAQDALDLGAVGMVTSFFLGYEEELEAACMRSTVQLALTGKALGLPLVVEVRTTGPRVSLSDKAVELGASYALEGGADVIALPYPGQKSLETIAAFVSVPWLVRPTRLETVAAEVGEALALGGAGIWLDHTVFSLPEVLKFLDDLRLQVHSSLVSV